MLESKEHTCGRIRLLALMVLIVILATSIIFPETFVVLGPSIGGNHLTPLTMLTPFLLVVGLVLLSRRECRLDFNILDLAVAALAAYIALRNIWGVDALGALKYSLFIAALYYVTAVLAADVKYRQVLFDTAVVLLAVVSFYEILEYIMRDNLLYGSLIAETVPQPRGDYYRGGSTLAHPVVLGAFILQAVPFSLFWWLKKTGWRKIAGIAITLMAGMALFLSFTRTSMVIGVVAAFAFACVYLWHNKKLVLITGVTFIVVGASMIAIWQHELTEVAHRTASYHQRKFAWELAGNAIVDRPIFGAGYAQAAAALRGQDERLQQLYEQDNLNVPVDNQYLSTIVEGGFMQMVFLLAVLGAVLAQCIKYLRRSGWQRYWILPPLAGLFLLLLNAVTFDPLTIWASLVFFWFEIGLIRGICSNVGKDLAGL